MVSTRLGKAGEETGDLPEGKAMSEQIRRAAAILGRRTFVMHTDRGVTVESFLTDAEACVALEGVTGRDAAFAGSLLESYRRYGSWTVSKRAWAHKLALASMYAQIGVPAPAPTPRPAPATVPTTTPARPQPVRRPSPTPTAPRPAPAVVLEMAGIMRLFRSYRTATAGLANPKKPKITFSMEGGRVIVLSIAGENARRPGTINVTNGKKYGEEGNVWFGRIDPETGVFSPGRDCDSMVVTFLKAFADDPAGVAGRYGRRTGFCCFCHKALTRGRGTGPRCRALYSVDVGYGPDCAKRYGLPFGMAAAAAAGSEAAIEEEAREEAVALAGQET